MERVKYDIDMTLGGDFRGSPPPPVAARVFGLAVLVAVGAGAVVIALLAIWFAMMLVPVAIGAALVAYGVFRYRLWRGGLQRPQGG